MSTREWDQVRYQLDSKDVKMKIFPVRITRKALQDTNYTNIGSLFHGSTAIAYSNADEALPELLKVTKKEPKLLLLGGILDNELLTPNSLKDAAGLPDVAVLHQQLLGTLQSSAASLSRIVGAPASKLSFLLNSHATEQ